MFEWAVLAGCERVLTLINISLWFWDFSLCNFRDLIYAQTACNTPKRKKNLKSHHMTPLIYYYMYFFFNSQNTLFKHKFSVVVRVRFLWLLLLLLWVFLPCQQLLPDVDLPIPAPSLLLRHIQDIRPRGLHRTTRCFETSAGKVSRDICDAGMKCCKQCCKQAILLFVIRVEEERMLTFLWAMRSGPDNLLLLEFCLRKWGMEAPCESSWFDCSEVKEFGRENK